jgi:hypothetical protein
MKLRTLFLLIHTLYTASSFAQKAKLPDNYTPLSINTHFGMQLPFANLSKRFGQNLNAGGGFEYALIPKGWLLGIDGYFLFGSKIKEDVLKNIRTPDGQILTDIGTYGDVFLRERGYYIGGHVGKLLTTFDNGNRIGGFNITLGAGFLQHKIKIRDENNAAPQVAPPYSEGYDRLTNGLALTQFIGYQIISRDKTINFSIGVDLTEGFTKNRRGFNFDTRQRDNAQRLDILGGLRATWSIVLFSNQNSESIEY